jgi:hypothetical protein
MPSLSGPKGGGTQNTKRIYYAYIIAYQSHARRTVLLRALYRIYMSGALF